MKKTTVVWAIDPFDFENGPSSEFALRFSKWLASCDMELQPAYVFSPLKHGIETCEQEAERYFRHLALLGDMKPLKLILNESASRSNAVQLLVEFADHEQSPFIITSSHGREGAERLVFGSFAEQLLIQSKRPILFLPRVKGGDENSGSLGKILFSTDFSEKSKSAFHHLLEQSNLFHSKITLFHSISLPLVEAAGYGMPVVMPENYIEEQEKWAREEGARWIQDANKRGAKCSLALYGGEAHYQVGKSILEYAEKNKVGMIAVTSPAGSIAAFLAGSVAREVFRVGRFPVLAFGPNSI